MSARGAVPAYLAGALAVLIWAGWIVATRFAVTEAVHPVVLANFRYGLPALVLAPVWLRRGPVPAGVNPWIIVAMALGWGPPFVFWVAAGLETVPAALMAPLVPGLMPLAVALLGWAVFATPLGPGARLGLVLIGASVALITGGWLVAGDAAALSGLPFLLMGTLGWAVYSLLFPRSRLSPIEATAYVSLYSLPALAGLALWRWRDFAALAPGDLAFHALTQGLLAGVAAVLAYGVAIRGLGVVRASALIALVPVTAALMATLLLGERPGALDWVAVVLASLGVAAATGALPIRARRARGR